MRVMPFEVPAGHKFACFALEHVSLDATLRGPVDPLRLGDNLTVLFQSPFDLGPTWREWLGSLQMDRLKNSNVLLVATAPSKALAILDGENQRLITKALSLFYALFMVDIFYHESAIAFSGASLGDGDGVEIRQTSHVQPHYRPSRFAGSPLRRGHFEDAGRIAEGIRLTHAPGIGTSRLKRGFHSWILAMQEADGGERLHQFVRSVEAVIKPTIGKIKRKFVCRCQLFVGDSNDNAEMLQDLVEMRGCIEHLNPVLDAVAKYPPDNRETIIQQRICQAQLLASFIYAQIFSDTAMRTLFSDENQIDQLWQSNRDQQRALWRTKLDWIRIIAARFA
jgi:hypothetical protein